MNRKKEKRDPSLEGGISAEEAQAMGLLKDDLSGEPFDDDLEQEGQDD